MLRLRKFSIDSIYPQTVQGSSLQAHGSEQFWFLIDKLSIHKAILSPSSRGHSGDCQVQLDSENGKNIVRAAQFVGHAAKIAKHMGKTFCLGNSTMNFSSTSNFWIQLMVSLICGGASRITEENALQLNLNWWGDKPVSWSRKHTTQLSNSN